MRGSQEHLHFSGEGISSPGSSEMLRKVAQFSASGTEGGDVEKGPAPGLLASAWPG